LARQAKILTWPPSINGLVANSSIVTSIVVSSFNVVPSPSAFTSCREPATRASWIHLTRPWH